MRGGPDGGIPRASDERLFRPLGRHNIIRRGNPGPNPIIAGLRPRRFTQHNDFVVGQFCCGTVISIKRRFPIFSRGVPFEKTAVLP